MQDGAGNSARDRDRPARFRRLDAHVARPERARPTVPRQANSRLSAADDPSAAKESGLWIVAATNRVVGRVAGLQPANHLDQWHHRHRIEEVHADEARLPAAISLVANTIVSLLRRPPSHNALQALAHALRR